MGFHRVTRVLLVASSHRTLPTR
ncbi:hypothetical protein PHL116M00_44 [Propionibacterium phage PHL116M00]|uniref:Uncharacterized protein n=1 Tax=Propionibacterium phage PHL116M00 TaxID=1500816 RepID=A0A0E3DN66_9CAUD|nr:hypothetical protein ACQ72_gp44 [Propionibacterium phage PHL116M00]AII29442.1 hypothetical protein PHL116M00_44 [Propionibacterium phage PHL116M00]